MPDVVGGVDMLRVKLDDGHTEGELDTVVPGVGVPEHGGGVAIVIT